VSARERYDLVPHFINAARAGAKKAELEGSGKSRHAFKKRMAKDRLEKFWQLSATFGVEKYVSAVVFVGARSGVALVRRVA